MPCVRVKADKATTDYLMQALFKNCIIVVILRNLKWSNRVLKSSLFLMSGTSDSDKHSKITY